MFEHDDFQARVAESGLTYAEYTRREAVARRKRVYGQAIANRKRRQLADIEARKKLAEARYEALRIARERKRLEEERQRIEAEKRLLFRKSWCHMITLAVRQKIHAEYGIAEEKHQKLVAHIISETAIKYKLDSASIAGKSRKREYVWARQEVYWRSRNETSRSYPEIARLVGYKDHSTIIYGVREYQRIQRVKAGLEAPKPGDRGRDMSLIIDGEGL